MSAIDPRPGDLLTARLVRRLLDLARRRLTVSAPLTLQESAGQYVVGVSEEAIDRSRWIKIQCREANQASYSWIEQIAAANGTWTDGILTGVRDEATAAWEANGDRCVPYDSIVRAWSVPGTQEWRFRWTNCPTTTEVDCPLAGGC